MQYYTCNGACSYQKKKKKVADIIPDLPAVSFVIQVTAIYFKSSPIRRKNTYVLYKLKFCHFLIYQHPQSLQDALSYVGLDVISIMVYLLMQKYFLQIYQRRLHEEYVLITLWSGGRQSIGLSVGTFKADSHIACRSHAVLLPCRAAKGLECVFPI